MFNWKILFYDFTAERISVLELKIVLFGLMISLLLSLYLQKNRCRVMVLLVDLK